jgi:hypothetical protein
MSTQISNLYTAREITTQIGDLYTAGMRRDGLRLVQ